MKNINKLTYLFIFVWVISIQSFGQNLSEIEKKIIASVNQNMPEAERLLEKVCNINSGTLNVEGVKAVGKIFNDEFQKIGFQTDWISLPDSLRRAGHLVVSRKGNQGKKLFLIGHLDTVFEKDMPFTPFTRLNDSTATAQGANDMKGGDVVIWVALKALQAHGLLENTTITAYFTGDEESAGKPTSISRADFIESAKKHDIALGFETAIGLHIVSTARRGASGWKLKTYGKVGHSSRVFSPESGFGSIYEAARILDEFRETLSKERYLTFNPGVIVGGFDVVYDESKAKAEALGKTNIISPLTIVTGDLRFITEQQKENARAKMREIVSKNLRGTKAEITFSDGIPAMEPSDGNEKLAEVLSKISEDIGIGKVNIGDPGSRGAGDISYIAKYVDCIDGLGASGYGAHAPGETINLKELPFLIQRAAILIYRLTR